MLDPTLFMQVDIITPLKLSPKAFIHRDDENYFLIGLVDKDEARKFVKHLISAIYSFADWMAPQDVLIYWPQDTVNDLLNVILSLTKDKVLLTEEEYNEITGDLTPNATLEEKEYLNDKPWIDYYTAAIKSIPPGSNVLHLGAKGAGYLTREIAKLNVNKVVGTIAEPNNYFLANKKAREENLNNIEFVYSKNQRLSPICFAEKFNVLVTELFASGTFEDQLLESLIYAKNNLLTPDCIFVPSKFDLKIFAYQAPIHIDMVQESKEFELLYGLTFNSFARTLKKHIVGNYFRLEGDGTTRLSDDKTIKTFDLATLKTAQFEQDFVLQIKNPGKICGFCAFFELKLPDDIRFSNSPFDTPTRFMQRIFAPGGSVYAEAGDRINLYASYANGNFRIMFG